MRIGSVSFPFIVFFSLALAACGGDGDQKQQAGAPPEAGFITVEAQNFTLINELPGRTSPYQIAEVRPQVTGIIEKRLFEGGELVKAGQPLYKIDDSLYRASVASAQAQVASAEATLKSTRLRAGRFDKLLKMKAVSQQEYDEAQAALGENKAQVDAARAALRTARINLDYTTIKAPIDGRIGRSVVTPGALVTANQTPALATIRQLDPIYVDLTQSNQELRRLRSALQAGRLQKVGEDKARVMLVLEDGSEYGEAGTLQFSEFAVEESTGSVTLRALFPNPESDLLPGMFVRARLPQGEQENAILVPQKGVTRDASGNATAMVIGKDNKVEQRKVTTERAVGNRWLISDGLKAGDRLILEGLQKIGPGAPVTPVELKQKQPDSATVTVTPEDDGKKSPQTEQAGGDQAQDAR